MATDLNKSLNLDTFITNLDEVIKKIGVLNTDLSNLTKTSENAAKATEELNKAEKDSNEIIEQTNKSNTELDKIQQQNLKTVQQITVAQTDTNKQLIRNKLTLQEINKEVKNEIKADKERFTQKEALTNALNKQATTINEATAQNKALRSAVRDVDLTTEEGIKKIEEYNKVIEANDKIITESSDAFIQQKRNIGAYQTALDGIKSGFDNVISSAKAFIANPIGAVITSLSAAFVSLKNALNSTEEGQRLLTQATGFLNGLLSGLNEIVVALIDPLVRLFTDPQKAIAEFEQAIKNKILRVFEQLKNIGLGVGKILSGIWERDLDKIKDGAKDAGKAFVNLQKETNPIAIAVGKIAEHTQKTLNYATGLAEVEAQRHDLEQKRTKFIVREAELQRDISEQILKSRNLSLDVRERQEAITLATELTNEKFNEQLALKQKQLELLEDERELGSDNLEDNKEYAQLQAEIIALEKNRNDALRQLTNRSNTLTSELEKQIELEQDLKIVRDASVDAQLLGLQSIQELKERYNEDDEEAARKKLELDKLYNDETYKLSKNTAESGIDLIGDVFENEKAASYAKAGINIAEGVTKALATGGIRGIAQGVIITAAGAIQLAKIAAAEYYTGTDNAKKGLAWVSERGAEIVEDKKGNMRLIPDMSLINLEGGEKVYTAQETKQIMFDDSRIIKELRRQKQTVIVNVNKESYARKYAFKT